MQTTLIKPGEIINGGVVRSTPLNSRFDQQLLAAHIKIAEERFVIDVLCADLYNDMVAQQNTIESNYNINVGSIVQKFPTNAAYETLWVEHLLYYTSNAVLYQALPNIAIQIGSNGLFLNGSNMAENAGVKGLTFWQDTIHQSLDVKRQTIENFLCSNQSNYALYPDYKCNNCEGCGHTQENCKGYTKCGKHNKTSKNTGIILY